MVTLANGSKEVRALEIVLGGELSKSSAKRPHADLHKHMAERLSQRKAHWAEVAPAFNEARAPLVDLLKRDKRTERSALALRKVLAKNFKSARATIRHPKRPRSGVEPRMVVGSGLTVKVPPYDNYGQHGIDIDASADVYTGQYSLNAFPVDGWAGGWAGVAVNFLAIEDNPSQRFAALVEYDYIWYDVSALSTAHNDAAMNIWVWGFTEDRWVYQNSNGLAPSWSDGTSWYEHHGSGGDGSEQGGTESIEAFFPAFAGNWYQAWVWSWGSCDNGFYSEAAQYQGMSVPFVVFGSL